MINLQIKAPRVFLINENGEQVGVVDINTARKKAMEAEFDLVEVSPKSNPPVVKIIDYGQYKYETEKRMRKALIVVNLVTMSLALFTLLIGPFAINLYAGSKYVSALPALQVHIWSLPFISIGLVVDIWLLNEHLQRLQVARTFTTAAVNIVLNILLVPKYGAVGAAWATLIAYTYPGFFANLLDKRTRAVFWLELRSIIPTPKNLQLIFEK